ncbi:MAG: hypothetical protein AABW64_04845 [Nanoarchaeota archaeon]
MVLLILLVLGLYFYTTETKLFLQKTIKATGNTARSFFSGSAAQEILSETITKNQEKKTTDSAD